MKCVRVHGIGQSDRVCDAVARAIVTEYEARDASSRLDIRVVGGRGAMFVSGNVTSSADFDVSSVVKRALAEINPSYDIEPFISFEASPLARKDGGYALEPVEVIGYATAETPEAWPRDLVRSRRILQRLEEVRAQDAEWFWLGPDCSVTYVRNEQGVRWSIDVEHVDSVSLDEVRSRIVSTIQSETDPSEIIRVNEGGAKTVGGLFARVGTSGVLHVDGWTSHLLPSSASGVGKESSHPENEGATRLRAFAKRLVQEEKGKVVLARAIWLPDESRPYTVQIRNERGEDLTHQISRDELDLRQKSATIGGV